MIYNALGLALVLLSAIVFQIIFSDSGDNKVEIVLDWDVEKDRRNFVVTFSYIGCAIALLIFVISSLSKRVVCRVIPCASLAIPEEVTRITNIVMQAFSVGLATVLVLN